jgi:hypothetical protein
MKKFFLIFLMIFTNPIAFAKKPQKKSNVSKVWPIELKAEVLGNLVKKDSHPILLLGLEKKDEVTLKVLQKSFAADPAIWNFSVTTQSGKNVRIDYDAASQVWIFKKEANRQYTVFVSKRKNNIENIQWLWFDL